MKTITREQLFQLLESMLVTTPELEHVIEDLKTKEFNEVEVTPPQHKDENWTFSPIYTKE